jgi:hypothetical protein
MEKILLPWGIFVESGVSNMGVFVGTAFLTGLLGKIAHSLWLRKKAVVGNDGKNSGAVKRLADRRSQSTRGK